MSETAEKEVITIKKKWVVRRAVIFLFGNSTFNTWDTVGYFRPDNNNFDTLGEYVSRFLERELTHSDINYLRDLHVRMYYGLDNVSDDDELLDYHKLDPEYVKRAEVERMLILERLKHI